jgi:hypothetical protein
MTKPKLPDSETPALANLAKLAKQNRPAPGLATLADLCRDMAVAPDAARARVSVADLAAMLERGDVSPPVVERFAVAVGRAFARTRP